jgi:hypothetical protein
MEKFINNLKAQAEANPMAALVIGTALLTAAGKFVDAAGSAAGSRAYARDVDRRIKNASK